MKQCIGWREWVSLPELGIARLKAKVDTGARTSALHAFAVTPFEQDGNLWVDFAIHPRQRHTEPSVACRWPVTDQRIVRDSGGHEEERYVIRTAVCVGNDRHEIEITLTDRDNMGFRMLIGRTALGSYVVDPSQSFLLGKRQPTAK